MKRLQRFEQFMTAFIFTTLCIWVSVNVWAETDAAKFAVAHVNQTFFGDIQAVDSIPLFHKLLHTALPSIIAALFVEDFIRWKR